jgi:hypothetical protein
LDVNPQVQEPQPRLFFLTNRDFLSVTYSSSTVWPPNHNFSLDVEIGEALSAPWLLKFGASWLFPCHAKILHTEHGEVATVSGIMTFESWTSLEEHDDFAEHLDDDAPLLAAIESSIGFEPDRDNAALANAVRLILQVEPNQSFELQEFLRERPL